MKRRDGKITAFPTVDDLLLAMFRHGCTPEPMDDDAQGWWAYCPAGDRPHTFCRLWADLDDGPPVECLEHSMLEIIRALREPPKPHVAEWSDFVALDGINAVTGEIERRRRGLPALTRDAGVVAAIAGAMAELIIADT